MSALRRLSRGEWIHEAAHSLRAIGVRLLYAWIVIGWILVIPAFFYFFNRGSL